MKGTSQLFTPDDLKDPTLHRVNAEFSFLLEQLLAVTQDTEKLKKDTTKTSGLIARLLPQGGEVDGGGSGGFPRVQYFRVGQAPDGYSRSTLSDSGSYAAGAGWVNGGYWDLTADTFNVDFEGFLPSAADIDAWASFSIYMRLPVGDYVQATGAMDKFIASPADANGYFFDTIRINRGDVPVSGELWAFIAASVNSAGVEEQSSGKPHGPGPVSPNTGTTYPELTIGPRLVAPGAVTINTGGITKEYFTDPATREARVRITIPYTAPAAGVFFNFSGVETYLEAPTETDPTPLDPTGGTIYPQGWHFYAGAAGGSGSAVFVLPRPNRQEGWRFYLASRNDAVSETLALTTDPTPTANTLVTVDPSAAINVTSFAISGYTTEDGSIKISYSFNLPTGSGSDWSAYDWDRVDIQVKSPSMGSADRLTVARFDTGTGNPGAAVTSSSTLPVENGTWTLYAVSYDTRDLPWGSSPSATVAVTAGPAQISEASISVTVPEFRTDSSGKQFAKVVVSYTPSSNADYIGVWVFRGATPPANPATAIFETGSPWYSSSNGPNVEFWLERPEAGDTYWAFVTGNSYFVTVTPTTATPKKTFTISAWGLSPQPTGFSVNVITGNNGGVPSGKYQFLFTKPVDAEYWYTMIERIATDSGFTPLAGASYQEVAGPIESDPASGTNVTNDWWPLPTTAEYWTFRATGISQAGLPNTVSRPTSNVTVPTSAGLVLDTNSTTTEIINQTTPDGVAGFRTYTTSGGLLPTQLSPGLLKVGSTLSSGTKFFLNAATNTVMSLYEEGGGERIRLTTVGPVIQVRDATAVRTAIGASGGGFIQLTNTSGTTKINADAANGTVTLDPSALPSAVTGMLIVDSGDSNKLKWYNGSSWQTAGGTGLGDPGGNGVVVRTALNTTINRTITSGGTNYISISNGDGVSGNPTISIGANVVLTDAAKTLATTLTVSGTIDFEGGSGTLKIQQKADAASVPAGANNELYTYFNTGSSKMVLVYRDGAGSPYELEFP